MATADRRSRGDPPRRTVNEREWRRLEDGPGEGSEPFVRH